jgi:uncharacterized protein
MGNPVVHFEIGCRNLEATGRFYSELFSWRLRPEPPAIHLETGSAEGIQGHITSLGHEPHHYVTFYVGVDDVAAALGRVKQLGGKRLAGPIDIPTGTFAWFTDPEGNAVGLWRDRG